MTTARPSMRLLSLGLVRGCGPALLCSAYSRNLRIRAVMTMVSPMGTPSRGILFTRKVTCNGSPCR